MIINRIWLIEILILAKRLTDKEKEDIVKFFISGKTIDELSKDFNFTKLTIIRNLKKTLGREYQDLINKSKLDIKYKNSNEKKDFNVKNQNLTKSVNNENLNEDSTLFTPFVEITPLNYEIENIPRKELSSIPIADIDFPKIVFMIVDKKVELEIKLLKDYPEWNFLPIDDLNRKTIEIYYDLKIAKGFCNKEQKVIKIPNTDVFRIASPSLLARGISRIISADRLIAL